MAVVGAGSAVAHFCEITKKMGSVTLSSQGIDLCVVKAAELNLVHIPSYTQRRAINFVFF